MKKIKLITTCILSAISIISTFALTACTPPTPTYRGSYNGIAHQPKHLVLNAGDTLTITNNHFQDISLDFEDFSIGIHQERGQNIVTIESSTITAVNSGYVVIRARLYQETTQHASGQRIRPFYSVIIANIHVINEATMTHITTAEELAAMNDNLDGHFILMADIDLAEWGDWTPIGRTLTFEEREPHQRPHDYAFRGMFVNPHEYRIKNLTITTSKTIREAGLFGHIVERGSLVAGIILEDIFIDVSDYPIDFLPATGTSWVGGIAAQVASGVWIVDCFVSGKMIGGGYMLGGIVGQNAGYVFRCTFKGDLIMTNEPRNNGSIGGIIGHNVTHAIISRVRENVVYADIYGGERINAGGIIGFTTAGCRAYCSTFSGTVTGLSFGTMIGFDAHKRGAVNFI